MEMVSTPSASDAVIASELRQIWDQDGPSMEFLELLFIVEGVDTFPDREGDFAEAGRASRSCW